MATAIETPQASGATLNALLLPPGLIDPSPTNPRKNFGGPKMEELIASVKERGVKVTVTVRPHPSKDGRYELVAGERRWRAAVKAKSSVIPAVIEQLTDNEVLELQAIENEQREDVHPLERAEHYQRMMAAGYTVEQLGRKLSRKPGVIYRDMKLAELIGPVKKQFLERKLSASQAILLARLQPAQQGAGLKFIIDEGRYRPVSVRDLQRWIETNVNLDLRDSPFALSDSLLVESAGSCTVCPKNTAVNQALSPELAKEQICTDPGCYGTKVAADYQEKKAEHAAKGEELFRLGIRYNGQQSQGIIDPNNWRPAQGDKLQCKGYALGYVTEAGYADGNHKIGDVIPVCLDKKCSKHFIAYGRSAPGADGKQKEEQKKLKAVRQAREQALSAIVAKAKYPPSEADLRDVLAYVGARLDVNVESSACRVLQIEGKSITACRDAFEKFTKTASRTQIAQGLIVCLAAPDAHPFYWNAKRATPVLDRLAKAARVDVGKLEREALAGLKKAEAKSRKKNAKPKRSKDGE